MCMQCNNNNDIIQKVVLGKSLKSATIYFKNKEPSTILADSPSSLVLWLKAYGVNIK